VQERLHRVEEAVREERQAERTYLARGSNQGNAHVHWPLPPLPPGTSHEKQQFEIYPLDILKQSLEELVPLAARLRTRIARPRKSSEPLDVIAISISAADRWNSEVRKSLRAFDWPSIAELRHRHEADLNPTLTTRRGIFAYGGAPANARRDLRESDALQAGCGVSYFPAWS